ncbi:MAG: hypothetical protein ABJ084_02160 [Halioglobus sp.]
MNLFDNQELEWKRYSDDGAFGYPINYADAVLDARDDGRLEILVKWEPNSYCHLHRHTAETSSIVLEGELQVIDIDLDTGAEVGTRTRLAGDFAHKEPGDVHMERGGPNGALVLFSIYAPDGEGVLAEALHKDGSIASVSTMKKILKHRAKQLG